MDGYHCSTTCPKLSGAVQTRYSDSPKRTQMLSNTRQPCDEAVVRTQPDVTDCGQATRRWVLAAAILGSSITFIDGTVVNVVLPVLQRELRASVAEAQWIIESYALMLAALILVGGSLGDRLGRRRVFSTGDARAEFALQHREHDVDHSAVNERDAGAENRSRQHPPSGRLTTIRHVRLRAHNRFIAWLSSVTQHLCSLG